MIDDTRRSRRPIEFDVVVTPRRRVLRPDDDAHRYIDTWSIEECEAVSDWDLPGRETG